MSIVLEWNRGVSHKHIEWIQEEAWIIWYCDLQSSNFIVKEL